MIVPLRTRFQALFVLLMLGAISGCAVPNSVPTTAPVASVHKAIVRGAVHGGQQPVSGAVIQLYTLGGGIDGKAATPLLTSPVVTDANGNFNITGLYSCANYGEVTYLTATGGNPGLAPGTNNTAIAAMAMLDVCGVLTPETFIDVNEVTTAATVIAYGQFFGQYPNIGVGSSNSAPGYNDVLYFDMIVNYQNGSSPGSTFPAGQQFPFGDLYAQANVIATCINSDGVVTTSSPCGQLFALTTPPGGTAPTNTVDALVNMQRYPTQNVPQLFALASPSSPFQPAATSAPANWYMRLSTGAPATPRFTLCTMWGDSLTLGSEDFTSITVPTTLASLPSCYWGNNQGISGQRSTQIGIREGGVTSSATVAGGIIPASGPVNISFPLNAEPLDSRGPGQVNTVLNGVPGALSFDYNQDTTIFTRTTPGLPVASPANTPYTGAITTENSGFVILWAGRNDPDDQGTLIQNNIAAMVAALPSPQHFVVLAIPNSNDEFEYAGATGYNLMIATNQALAQTYPNNYIDVRALVIANYDPTSPEDVIDHSHDTTPTSLRAVDESGDLATPMDNATCTFSVENGGIYRLATMNIEQEKIRILASDGINVTSCIRGYASTTAVAHTVGTTFTGTDAVHLNHLGDVIIGKAIDAYIQSH